MKLIKTYLPLDFMPVLSPDTNTFLLCCAESNGLRVSTSLPRFIYPMLSQDSSFCVFKERCTFSHLSPSPFPMRNGSDVSSCAGYELFVRRPCMPPSINLCRTNWKLERFYHRSRHMDSYRLLFCWSKHYHLV